MEPPNGGTFVPTGVINWYEIIDHHSNVEIIYRVFANPATMSAVSIEEPGTWCVNSLGYDDWDDYMELRDGRGFNSEGEAMDFVREYMARHSTPEQKKSIGELFG